jgi:D-sedoheptulose 7-phosphate isomerase
MSESVSNAAGSVCTRRIAESISIKQLLLQDPLFQSMVEDIARRISAAFRGGHKVMFMGNGGSAADSQHLAAEFTGRYLFERRALPALALSVNTSAITAIGNDTSFEMVFARQIEALGLPGDVAIGLSTSGNSRNVLLAMQVARERKITTVALTGESGGLLKDSVDICLRVPSTETPRIQECHIMVGHIICEIVEQEVCG